MLLLVLMGLVLLAVGSYGLFDAVEIYVLLKFVIILTLWCHSVVIIAHEYYRREEVVHGYLLPSRP